MPHLKESLNSFQANWYRAAQYCRYHGMHLASIASQEENDRLEKHIRDFGELLSDRFDSGIKKFRIHRIKRFGSFQD